jgi:hypothetical protein
MVLLLGGTSAADTATRVGPAVSQAPPLYDMSYGYITRGDGTWSYPDSPVHGVIAPDGGLTPDVVIPKIESSGSYFVKVARETPPDQDLAGYYDHMHSQTPPLQLGVRLNVRPKPGSPQRTVEGLLKSARHLSRAPMECTPAPSANPCYFDWIFLDGGMLRSAAGLQRLVDGLHRDGLTGGGGWDLVMSNDTGWPKQKTRLARGEWAHSHSFGLLHKPWDPEEKRRVVDIIKHHPNRVITRSDRSFIRAVRRQDPGSHPVLKFEVHTETDRLQKLGRLVQIRLLRELTHAESRYHFKMVYPLFVGLAGGHRPNHCGGRTACNAYNSLRRSPSFAKKLQGQGTYAAQRMLMLGNGSP